MLFNFFGTLFLTLGIEIFIQLTLIHSVTERAIHEYNVHIMCAGFYIH